MAEKKKKSARPFWSGTISFGLVNIPVELYPANRNVRPRLRMLAPDGVPLSRRFYCPEHTHQVHPEHIVRGYEVDKDEYIVVHDDELEAIEPQKTREINLKLFVPRDQLPPLYFERAYYLTPGRKSAKAYQLLADTLEDSDRAGVATFVMRSKEYLIAIVAEGGLLQAETLRFQDEVRSPEDVGLPKPKAANARRLNRFRKSLLKLQKNNLAISELKDDYAEQFRQLVQKKQKAGKDLVSVESVADDDEDEDDVDLLATIRQSLKQANGKNGTPKRKRQRQSDLSDKATLATNRKPTCTSRLKTWTSKAAAR